MQNNDAKVSEQMPSDFSIFKNLVCIGLAFVITFTATNSLGILQSSINSDEGLGTATLSVGFASGILSSMFLPSLVIDKFGCKWTMAVSTLFCVAGIAANLKPVWATMIPMSIVQGLGISLLWGSQNVYTTRLAKIYADRHKKSFEATTNIFFGIFFTMYQTTQIWGNIVSAKLLQPRGNSSQEFSAARLAVCGIDYCNEDLASLDMSNVMSANSTADIVPHSNKQDPQLRLLIEVYLGVTLFATMLLAITVSPLPKTVQVDAPVASGLALTLATFRQFGNKMQVLLMPITLFRGMGEGFLATDYGKGFIMCTLGLQSIGLVAISFGICASLASFVFGLIVKVFGRLPVFILSAACNLASIILMFTVHPSPDSVVLIYLIPTLWGLADACWTSQVTALYGILFYGEMEAAFGSYRLADSIGFIIATSWSSRLCIRLKLSIMLGFFCIALAGYFTVECIMYFNSKRCIPISKQKPSLPD